MYNIICIIFGVEKSLGWMEEWMDGWMDEGWVEVKAVLRIAYSSQ